MFRSSSDVELTVLKGERLFILEQDPGDGWGRT